MIITLTTDFGLRDAFVGIMKGVILGIAPQVQIVDLSHEIPSYNSHEAALIVSDACLYFPAGTIHVVVVDPGVGSARRPIAVRAGANQIFIAPDNGALSLLAPFQEARQITNSAMFRHPVSSTFHGRDIFAPVAAGLAVGAAFESVGPVITDPVQFAASSKPAVLRVDKFGNLITNLRPGQLGPGFVIRANGVEIRNLRASYAEAAPDEVFAIVGSSGRIELCINQNSAAERLNLGSGAEIEVETGTLNQ